MAYEVLFNAPCGRCQGHQYCGEQVMEFGSMEQVERFIARVEEEEGKGRVEFTITEFEVFCEECLESIRPEAHKSWCPERRKATA